MRQMQPPQALSLSDELLIPYSPPLEYESIPGVERIAERVRELVSGQSSVSGSQR
jgi:hypothetical protein